MTDSRDSIPMVSSAALEAEKSRALAKATSELRDDAGLRALDARTSADWSALDDALFAKLDREEAQVAAATRFRGSRAAWGVLAGITAAAAAMLVLAGHVDHDTITGEGRSAHARSASSEAPRDRASKLARSDSAAAVTVNGQSASRERPMAAGDAIEVHGGRAIFVEPSKVTWALESASRVSIGHAGGPLVLALERGAVEAQVAHVELGEAFAVDIDSARVAVHGTHLRVERFGEKVVVDLTDGVISVGPAPLRGSTYGSLVTAPAHVEFQVSDPRGTLKVEHTAGFVRTATSLPIEDDAPRALAAAEPRATPPVLMNAAPAPVAVQSPVAHAVPPSATLAPPPEAVAAPASSAPEPVAANTPPLAVSSVPAADAPAASPPAAPAPQKPMGVAAAVKVCWEKNAPVGGDVTITVRSTLTVESDDEGTVHTAIFDPPLPAAVQTCASEEIYRTRFAGAARIAIPIVLTR